MIYKPLCALTYRCPLKTLQKCEIALEKLKNDMAVVRTTESRLLSDQIHFLVSVEII